MAKRAYLEKQCPRLRTGWKLQARGEGDGSGGSDRGGGACERVRGLGVRRRR